MKTRIAACLITLSINLLTPEFGLAQPTPEHIPLWPNGAPGFEERKNEPEQAESYWVRNIHNPSITAYRPPEENANGAAVLICPGGGHREIVFDAEGREPAEFFASIGVAAFVLKYRLGREPNSPYDIAKHPREDALRAMRSIRNRAAVWNVDPSRIGIMGFSAGGEVAAMTAFGTTAGDRDASDPIDRIDAKPNFLVLVYPGSLGIPESVSSDAPPVLLAVTSDDRRALRTTTQLLEVYREAGASVEAHIFARGGHAFNMGSRSNLRSLQNWPARISDWMADNYISDPTLRDIEQQRESEIAALRDRERAAVVELRKKSRRKRIAEATEIYDCVGTWTWERHFGKSTTKQTVVISRDGNKLEGTYETDSKRSRQGPTPLTDIVVEANELNFTVKREWNGRSFSVNYCGTVDENTITGYYEINFGERIREVEWKAIRTDPQ